jgi:hypothetical protein
MIFPGSRYEKTGTLALARPGGTTVRTLRLPLPGPAQRLDLIANRFLADPTAFWRLCDANNAVVPDALATRDLVGIPFASR